jgi:hypothetical protein
MEPVSTSEPPSGQMGIIEGMGSDLSTLDEPIRDTIMRDLTSIGLKLKYVMLPRSRVDKAAGLKQWDLWGPLFICLALSIVLSTQAPSDQAGYVFALVYVLVWIGSGVVTINAQLLKGQLSFFQSVCVLGYCVFPLVIAAFFCALLPSANRMSQLVKVILVVLGFTWATGASVGFMTDCLPEDRQALGVYPVWLFYVAIAWIVLLT